MRRTLVIAAVALLLVSGALGGSLYLDDVARDALSSAEFSRIHSKTPADFGLAFQDVRLHVDGLNLSAWWMPGLPGMPTVILVHGHSANMTKVVRHYAPNLRGVGYNLLALDLRNHGQSDNTTAGSVTYGVEEMRDVQAAIAYARAEAKRMAERPRIILYGESMGAVAAILAASDPDVVAVVSDSAYASFEFQARQDGAKRGYPGFVVDWVLDRIDAFAPSPPSQARPDAVIGQLNMPILLAHCSNDQRIQDASFSRLAAAANPDKLSTWHAECADGDSKEHHVDGWATPGYNATVLGFLARAG